MNLSHWYFLDELSAFLNRCMFASWNLAERLPSPDCGSGLLRKCSESSSFSENGKILFSSFMCSINVAVRLYEDPNGRIGLVWIKLDTAGYAGS